MKYNKFQLIILYIIGMTLTFLMYTAIILSIYAFIKKLI